MVDGQGLAGVRAAGFAIMPAMRMNLLIIVLLSVLLMACAREAPGTPAPLGDYAVLEQLATAYRTVAQDYPMQPRQMPPAGRKEFVTRVFHSAGYDYSATLHALAAQGLDRTSQDHRDLADLLLLPHQGVDHAARAELYSDQELADIEAIEAALR
jgi:hypothetical protein